MKHSVDKPESVHISSYANLVLLNKVYSQLERRDWFRARKSFLTEEINKHGKLTCFYCKRSDLKLKAKKRSQQATVDHLIPKSLGGHASDKTNFVVCCNSCNQKKGSATPDNFLNSRYLESKKKYHLS